TAGHSRAACSVMVEFASHRLATRYYCEHSFGSHGMGGAVGETASGANLHHSPKIKTQLVLEERNRIARELHDTLEQELAGITMQLDLATDCFHQAPRVAQQALQTARDMSRHSMVEARRSVWD